MKKILFFIVSVYLFFAFSGSLFGSSEKKIFLGGASSWDSALIRQGICESSGIRPHSALVLTAGAAGAAAVDLALSFDEGNPGLFRDAAVHYQIRTTPALEAAGRQWARAGSGAALFSGAHRNGDPLLIECASADALFAPGSRFTDFSLELWLHPFQLENGEQILTWTSSLPQDGQFLTQYISCVAEKNRLKWTFFNFFASAGRTGFVDVELSGDMPVVPKTWSHHIVRFDSATGMIEYVVDGGIQAIAYATVSGREAGTPPIIKRTSGEPVQAKFQGAAGSHAADVYTPVIGQRGVFSLGSRYTGLIDEFRIYRTFLHQPALDKFPAPGRMETRVIDLGAENSEVYQVDARGGRTSLHSARGSLEFRENGRFRFSDDSEIQFFIRTAEYPYLWGDSPWLAFTPGMPVNARGRYAQIAADFYPSANGDSSPYLEELRISYIPVEAPLPPTSVHAVAADGSVQLRWKSSPVIETDGYLVYYGTKKGEYYGTGAIPGTSPIDAGKQNNLRIDGLKNGVLYYFCVAAYKAGQDSPILHIGEFSRELTARPLEGLQF